MSSVETKAKMTPLLSQELFESLIAKNPEKPHDPIVIIKFGANWCNPCKKIDKNALLALSDKIKWYECDVDENDYTPGYCGVRSIPAFLAILNGKPQPLFGSSDTNKVIEWIKGGFKPTAN
jgi:thioredoxin-like negative regulator of GroEL